MSFYHSERCSHAPSVVTQCTHHLLLEQNNCNVSMKPGQQNIYFFFCVLLLLLLLILLIIIIFTIRLHQLMY